MQNDAMQSSPDASPTDGSAPEPDGSSPEPDARDNDAAPGDAGMDSGLPISLYCPEIPGHALCDGFEDPNFGRWTYPVQTNGTVAQSTTRKRTGTYSLRAATGAAGANNAARYRAKAFDHVKSGDLWLRAYYYILGSTTINTNISTSMITEIEAPYVGFSLMVLPAEVQIGEGSNFYPETVKTAFPRDQWVCVELHVKVDATASRTCS